MSDLTVPRILWQTAPYPERLEMIVDDVHYKDWALNLGNYEREVGGEGLTLRIRFQAADSSHDCEDCTPPVIFWIHDFEVPARVLDDESWTEWVFDCIMLAERHEAMEQFMVAGERVFYPAHSATSDMYKTKHVVHRKVLGDDPVPS